MWGCWAGRSSSDSRHLPRQSAPRTIPSMERTEAERTLASLRGEVVATERRLAALGKLVEGYIELFPDLADSQVAVPSSPEWAEPDNRPKGQEAVRRVMMESPGQWFTVPYMLAELRRRDWLPESDEPGNAVRASLTRLVVDPQFQKGRGAKTGAVTFAYKPHFADDTDHHAGAGESAPPSSTDPDGLSRTEVEHQGDELMRPA